MAMKTKRIFLATGLALLIFSAAHRVGAGVTGDVEVDGYGGQTTGGWICGPMARVKYGGGAVQASIVQRGVRTPEGENEGQGTVVTIGGAAEGETIELINDSTPPSLASPGRPILGGQIRAGYRWKWIGIEGGAGMFQGWDSPTAESPVVLPYPSVELSVGPRGKGYGVFGGGAPFATSIMRPGLYTGGGFVLDNKMAFDLRAGLYRQGPSRLDAIGPRIDVAGRGPIADFISLRLGANIGFPEHSESPDFEGSAGLIFDY